MKSNPSVGSMNTLPGIVEVVFHKLFYRAHSASALASLELRHAAGSTRRVGGVGKQHDLLWRDDRGQMTRGTVEMCGFVADDADGPLADLRVVFTGGHEVQLVLSCGDRMRIDGWSGEGEFVPAATGFRPLPREARAQRVEQAWCTVGAQAMRVAL